MGRAIGIDLGEHLALAAICENGEPRVLQNRESQDLTPSVVGMHKKQQVSSGQLAVDRAALAPKETIYSVKRLMAAGVRRGKAIMAAKMVGKMECSSAHVNLAKNVVCDVCGEPLGTAGRIRRRAREVTGMHYGIQGEGDRFEIIIPKGSSFPTLKPARVRLFTRRDNKRRLRVPIYAGFDTVATKNELQATVWLELPDNVPANTPLEFAIALDVDGILEKVRVALLAGSG